VTVEQQREYDRNYYADNRERIAEYHRNYYQANRDLIRARSRASKAANPERTRAVNRAWHAAHPGHARAVRIKHHYGLTTGDFDAMLAAQDGKCAICAAPFGAETPNIDHDHNTGGVRGLLCRDCNFALGRFADDPDRLSAAIAYLASHQTKLEII
jgi:hypothetical protein